MLTSSGDDDDDDGEALQWTQSSNLLTKRWNNTTFFKQK